MSTRTDNGRRSRTDRRSDPTGGRQHRRRNLLRRGARRATTIIFRQPVWSLVVDAGRQPGRRHRARGWWFSIRLPVFVGAQLLAFAGAHVLLTAFPRWRIRLVPRRWQYLRAHDNAHEAVPGPQRPHHRRAHRRADLRVAGRALCRDRRRQRHQRPRRAVNLGRGCRRTDRACSNRPPRRRFRRIGRCGRQRCSPGISPGKPATATNSTTIWSKSDLQRCSLCASVAYDHRLLAIDLNPAFMVNVP